MLRQRSSVSVGSLTFKQELCYDDMTDAELQQELENINDANLLLRLENDVFERYLARKEPESLQTIAQLLETTKRVHKIAPQPRSQRASPIISTRASVANIYDRDTPTGSVSSIQIGSRRITQAALTDKMPRGGPKISYTYRIEMVNTELRELQKMLINFERTSTKKKTYLGAQAEESEISIFEICKSSQEFEDNIVQKSIKKKIPAEKFLRFVEEWLKATNIAIERVKLKMTGVKSQIRKVRMQLEHSKTLGEALRTIDFEQLSIENQDCMRKIEEKNRHLLQMKKIAGRYSIALTRHKGKLDDLISTLNKIKDQIVFKKLEIKKLRSKQAVLKIEIESVKKQVESITTLIDNFEVPDVIDFIKMRVELEKLRRIYKQLSRQKKIQQIMLKSNR